MSEIKDNPINEDSLELSIYKFMHYLNSSSFYAILIAGSFFSAMMLNSIFFKKSLNDNASLDINQTIFLSATAFIIGMLLWRSSINRIDSKESIKRSVAILSQGNETAKTEKIASILKKYKKFGIEKLRKIRLIASIITSSYLLFLSFSIADYSGNIEDAAFFSKINIVYLIFITSGVITSIITTFFINKAFNKGVKIIDKENQL